MELDQFIVIERKQKSSLVSKDGNVWSFCLDADQKVVLSKLFHTKQVITVLDCGNGMLLTVDENSPKILPYNNPTQSNQFIFVAKEDYPEIEYEPIKFTGISNSVFSPTLETCRKHLESTTKTQKLIEFFKNSKALVEFGSITDLINLDFAKSINCKFLSSRDVSDYIVPTLADTQKTMFDYHSTVRMLVEKTLDVENKLEMLMVYFDNFTNKT